MKQKLLYSALLFLPSLGFAQEAKFQLAPYVNAVTTLKDGLIEAGPEFQWVNDSKGKTFVLRPSVRTPLTNKSESVVQLDRFTSTWRGILALQHTWDLTQATGNIKRRTFSGQFEYGSSEFKYYPTGSKSNESATTESSYAFEVKYISYFRKRDPGAREFSPQFRIRYSYDWKASNEVGVVNPPNSNGVSTTTNMIVAAPSVKPTLSPAFSLQYYPGKGSFSYSPSFYYDLTGEKGTKNPFDNLSRFRIENWFFYYPSISGTPNVKIGVSPFVSFRTAGVDDFKKIEYGGMITVKFGTTFLHFL